MPEIRFQIEWPDGSRDICYSPSLVVKEYFTAKQRYPLEEFQMRSQGNRPDKLCHPSDMPRTRLDMPFNGWI
ncbi:hypothetical protein XM38_027700 [Halomicronema hongdechloris C2206]|uniref:Uncharacterized protein n=1 Tax=Halomicronema hongdechloris C2206 TaxID=1641165 RepID=A0A1Z3HNG9_9CYAN|nr:hypothetical protein [Halomicronema hongdechloris]ASC71816.1 hypothetical protein XM38_027700 [Halomicronema hongdechloris C2206]